MVVTGVMKQLSSIGEKKPNIKVNMALIEIITLLYLYNNMYDFKSNNIEIYVCLACRAKSVSSGVQQYIVCVFVAQLYS